MRVFGLTGGIASGKSTVARCFREEGFPMVDADVLARHAVAPGSKGLAEIVETFGAAVLDAEGILDRKRLGAMVFADKEALARLNAIVHPRVAELAMAAFEEQSRGGAEWVGYEVPLLVENGLHHMFRPVVVVATDEATQLRRLMERDGLSEVLAKNRIAAQLPLEEKLAVADFVIENVGSIEDLRAQVARVASTIRAWDR